MARTDANPPLMPFTDAYQLVEVDADYLTKAVKPKQFIHIDQTECIMCEGCVDICPWKCIHMVNPSAIAEASGTELPGTDPSDNVLFIIDDDICTPPVSSSSGRWAFPTATATPTLVPTTTAMPTACASDRRDR
jgi:ferredoxin